MHGKDTLDSGIDLSGERRRSPAGRDRGARRHAYPNRRDGADRMSRDRNVSQRDVCGCVKILVRDAIPEALKAD